MQYHERLLRGTGLPIATRDLQSEIGEGAHPVGRDDDPIQPRVANVVRGLGIPDEVSHAVEDDAVFVDLRFLLHVRVVPRKRAMRAD